jgi:DNA-binding CsgD family transcriptional regulator
VINIWQRLLHGDLFISVNTINRPARHWRKLGVNHRGDAIAAARQHGLL